MRSRIKVTLSYQPGLNPLSPHFSQIQMSLEYPKSRFYCESSVFKYDNISFEGNTTPKVENIFLYPLRKLISDNELQVTLTY